MSFKIQLELPLVTILAIQDAAKHKGDTKALEDVHRMTDRALMKAVSHISPDTIQTAIMATPGVRMGIIIRD